MAIIFHLMHKIEARIQKKLNVAPLAEAAWLPTGSLLVQGWIVWWVGSGWMYKEDRCACLPKAHEWSRWSGYDNHHLLR